MRKSFRGFLLAGLGAILLTAVSGCSSSMYNETENWAIIDSDTPAYFVEYDLIFLYPSQEEVAENGYMNWIYGNIGDEIRRYVRLVIAAQFGARVRVFSPFVPLLGFNEYESIMTEFKKDRQHHFDFYKTRLQVPIDHMVDALNTYFRYYNTDGHPFVVFGQEQGALVLYEALKRCSRVNPKNGFVVGYFFGVPGVTNEEIIEEFGGRGIKPASKSHGAGVIAICNTRCEGTPIKDTLAMANGAVVNPLTWNNSTSPAGRKMNPGALFFNRNEHNPAHKVRIVPSYCGAAVDSKNGIVTLVGVPPADRPGLSETRFSSNVWGIFAKSVSRNARERVLIYKFGRKGVKLHE